MSLPPWIAELRRTEVIERVHADGRTSPDRPLGIGKMRIQSDAICGGQADFDALWKSLSGDDRALLYCYYNQLGHLEELTAAFQMLFGRGTTMDDRRTRGRIVRFQRFEKLSQPRDSRLSPMTGAPSW